MPEIELRAPLALPQGDELKVLKIANGDDISKAVAPTDETIKSNEYAPLSRPLYLYVNTESLKRKASSKSISSPGMLETSSWRLRIRRSPRLPSGSRCGEHARGGS